MPHIPKNFDHLRQETEELMEKLATISGAARPVPATLTDDLSESIQDLYQVFERYPVRRDMPHCMSLTEALDLLARL